MKHSRKYFLEKIFSNVRIQEALRELTSTSMWEERNRLSEEFEEILRQEGTPVVKECIGDGFKDAELIRMGINPGLYGHLSTMAMGYDRLVQIMDRYELIYPEIGTDKCTYVIINDFVAVGKENYLNLKIYYTGNEQMDKRIDDMVAQLGR